MSGFNLKLLLLSSLLSLTLCLPVSPPLGMPSFIKSPDDQTGISGGVASFVCQAEGEPKPRITWMKKGKKVSSQRFEVRAWRYPQSLCLKSETGRNHRLAPSLLVSAPYLYVSEAETTFRPLCEVQRSL